MNEITQSPVQFGSDLSLLGMVTMPARQPHMRIGCLMLNMGANHRVGPHRINVKLAHALSAEGMASLRFDLGGVGDSRFHGAASALRDRAVADLQAAMDMMASMLDIRRFVIMGMCSGAEHAISAALSDPRVVGISMFDGFNFPDRRSRWANGLRRAWAAPMHPAFAGKASRWLAHRLFRRTAEAPLAGFFTDGRSISNTADWFRDAMNWLTASKVSIQMIFSGSIHVRDRDQDQLGAFRQELFARNAHYHFLREADHTLCTMRGQSLVIEAVRHWAIDLAWKSMEDAYALPANDFRKAPGAATPAHATGYRTPEEAMSLQ